MKPMKKYSKKDICCYCGGVNGHKDNCPLKRDKQFKKGGV